MTHENTAVVLTIAGSDSGGGAGIQADLRAFATMGVYGTSAVTAITAQNTAGVRDIFPLTGRQVREQLEAVLDDIPPLATKTGMLATPQIAREVAAMAKAKRLGQLVVDPVMVSTSGQDLGMEGLERELACELIPLSDLVTPNIEEAMRLTGVEIISAEDMREAALAMTEMNARAICITGGHLRGDPVDILFDGEEFHQFSGPRIGGPDARFHGTGCLFSAGVAGHLGLGMNLVEAVGAARKLVERAISQAIRPGKGMSVPWLSPWAWQQP